MKDNEITKALECCVKNDVAQCTICPYFDMLHGCRIAMEKEVLDLINRQKAEIESLKHHCFGMRNELEAYKDTFNMAIEEAKSEAIKEFAERLKKGSHIRYDSHTNQVLEAIVYCGEINTLVKEMTER